MTDPTTADLAGVVAFLQQGERLKAVTRNAWVSTGQQESVAEHTWRLALMALVLGRHFPGVDLGRVLQILVVHDLGEAIHGDIAAPAQAGLSGKAEQERADLLTLLAPLPAADRAHLQGLWEEYEAAATPEAQMATALDKLKTILPYHQGANPPDFDCAFTLEHGKRCTAGHPVIVALRAMLDAETAARAADTRAQRAPAVHRVRSRRRRTAWRRIPERCGTSPPDAGRRSPAVAVRRDPSYRRGIRQPAEADSGEGRAST
jgi:putative hydrolase of HD superfamily